MNETKITLTPTAQRIAATDSRDGFYYLSLAIIKRAIKDYKRAYPKTDEESKATVREVESFFEGRVAEVCCRILEGGKYEFPSGKLRPGETEGEISPKEILNRTKSEAENSRSRQKTKKKRKETQNDNCNNNAGRSAVSYNAA